MLKKINEECTFIFKLWKLGILSAIEYRVSFFIQVFSTFINDVIYFIFWVIFFDKFKSIAGYELNDVLIQFSIVTTGFGLAFSFFGNIGAISNFISQGLLDRYLTMPKNTLLHLLASKFSVSSLGDAIFGIVVFLITGKLSFLNISVWIILSLLSSIIFLAFYIILGSLAFWLGKSDGLVGSLGGALVTFSLYPNTIFKGVAKFILLTIIPAALIGIIPVNIINYHNYKLICFVAIYAFITLAIGITLFNIGLKKYSSGNIININS